MPTFFKNPSKLSCTCQNWKFPLLYNRRHSALHSRSLWPRTSCEKHISQIVIFVICLQWPGVIHDTSSLHWHMKNALLKSLLAAELLAWAGSSAACFGMQHSLRLLFPWLLVFPGFTPFTQMLEELIWRAWQAEEMFWNSAAIFHANMGASSLLLHIFSEWSELLFSSLQDYWQPGGRTKNLKPLDREYTHTHIHAHTQTQTHTHKNHTQL